jgi:hypothetical protein
MNGIKYSSDVASQLLNSSDSRVAAAARRVFSNAIIIECQEPNEEYPKPNISHYESKYDDRAQKCTDSNVDRIPFDIKEAASAVAMLAPGKCAVMAKTKIMPAIVRNTNTFRILDNVVERPLPILSSSSPPAVPSSKDVKMITPFAPVPAVAQNQQTLVPIKVSSLGVKNSPIEIPISEKKRSMSPDERLKRR